MEIESGVDLVDRSSPEKRSQPEEGEAMAART